MTGADVIGSVLATEATCREFLRQLEQRGVKFNIDLNDLSHEECIEVGIKVYTELVRNEKLQSTEEK